MQKSTSLARLPAAFFATVLAGSVWAQAPGGSAPKAPSAAPAGAASAKPRPPVRSAKPAARASAAPAESLAPLPDNAQLSAGQLEVAQLVYIGKADCEFGEQIDLNPVDGKPGHFQLRHRRATYELVPEETSTGAVRLENKPMGIVWLQIPAKSMLMNSKAGQRVADNCQMHQQKGVTPVARASSS